MRCDGGTSGEARGSQCGDWDVLPQAHRGLLPLKAGHMAAAATPAMTSASHFVLLRRCVLTRGLGWVLESTRSRTMWTGSPLAVERACRASARSGLIGTGTGLLTAKAPFGTFWLRATH